MTAVEPEIAKPDVFLDHLMHIACCDHPVSLCGAPVTGAVADFTATCIVCADLDVNASRFCPVNGHCPYPPDTS